MRVLHGQADLDEQLQALAHREAVGVAVAGDALARDQLHREEGAARVGRAGVEDAGDVRVVHHRERLALQLEAGDDALGVHAEADDLQRDLPAHRLFLFGEVNHAAAPLPQPPDDAVAADARGVLRGRRRALPGGAVVRGAGLPGGLAGIGRGGREGRNGRNEVEKSRGLHVRGEQRAEPGAQGGIGGAGLVEEDLAHRRIGQLERGGEQRPLDLQIEFVAHAADSLMSCISRARA